MTDEDSPPPSMDVPPPPPDAKSVRIAGAGTEGMAILLVSLTMLFFASIAAFTIIRFESTHRDPSVSPTAWPPPGFPPIPNTLWLSTLVILISSVTIQKALNAVRRDDEKGLLRSLYLTFGLGVAFLCMQAINWWDFYRALPPATNFSGVYLAGFYILTALHAAHVLGGLIPLAIVIHHARRGRYSRNFYPGVRYSTIYWHFLDVIWVILFCFIYF